jgi:LmbE family N-acetylglucosaminyl deacetylase
MLRIKDLLDKKTDLRVLLLGAHSDDIEIGCGGSVFRLLEEYPKISITWIVFSATGDRALEAEQSAARFLNGINQPEVIIRDYRDGYFPYIGGEIKSEFEQLKNKISPDLIFTHFRSDLHQDHRLIQELTWNTFRNHLILEYEIPKYDGDLGSPNFFIPLASKITEKKVDIILSVFQSQRVKKWFTRETFFSMMRLRGVECNSATGYAEGFYCRKLVF